MQESLFVTEDNGQLDFFNDHEQPCVTANPTDGGVRLIFRDALAMGEMKTMKRVLRGNVFGCGDIVTVNERELFVKWYDKKTGDKHIATRLLNLPAELKHHAEHALTMWRTTAQSSLF